MAAPTETVTPDDGLANGVSRSRLGGNVEHPHLSGGKAAMKVSHRLPATLPLGWKNRSSLFGGGSNIEIPGINDLVLKADVRSRRPIASAHL